ncbi:MAG: tetratricopeptide repeat protein [Candidatus Scalindua rubra]|nr:tetratricopeptide repeat protein [Candidatus Scalindua rubra]TWU34061.1 tetratricopeptide repeat protein [Candidatus Brocadiaceae bacterium S225]
MKIELLSKTKRFQLLTIRKLFIISIVCLFIVQNSSTSSAVSILRVEPSVFELQNQAFYNLRRGRLVEVFKNCEELLAINKKSILAYELLQVAYAAIGNVDRAQELIDSLKDASTNLSLTHLSKGIILLSRQKFDEAIEECQTSITLDKDNPLALYYIGRIHTDKKEFDKADEYLRKAVESEPELALAYTGLGINYLLQGNAEESFKYYKKALEIDEDEHMARMGLATILVGLKGYEKAIEQFKLVIKKVPTFIRARQSLAALYLQMGRFKDAIEQSVEILKIDPDTTQAYMILARSYSYIDNFDDAIKSISKFIEIEESSFEGNYLLGTFQIASGDIKSAKDTIGKAESIDTGRGNMMIASALINHIEGNHDTAEIYLKKAQEVTPEIHHPMINIFLTNLYLSQEKVKSAEESLKISDNFINGFRSKNLDLKSNGEIEKSFAYTNLAIFFYLNKWYDKTIKMCDAALALHPDNPITMYVKGKTLIDKKDFSQAFIQLEKTVEIQPDFISPHYDLAKLYLLMGETDNSVEEYKRLADLDPENASVRLSIGNIYSRQGKIDKAIEAYQQVIALAPDSPVGYNELAYHYAESETNLDEGLEYALKATKLAPNDAAILDTLGWIYFKKNNFIKAIESLKSAVASRQNSPTMRFHLGMAYYRSNDLKNALNEFKNSLEISARFQEASKAKDMIRLIEGQLDQTQK